MAVEAIDMSKRLDVKIREVNDLTRENRFLKADMTELRTEHEQLRETQAITQSRLEAKESEAADQLARLNRWDELTKATTPDALAQRTGLQLQESHAETLALLTALTSNLNLLTAEIQQRVSGWCVKCRSNPSDVVLEPCNHMSLCQSCASGLNECNLCNRSITNQRIAIRKH
eukprot:c13267_g1_i3.p1 GENE.c13267_g1_i3~~c13267_g1_i3.p1  ORF type:complete len:200 (+),score=37.98 c13267_g1_i3:82-600(+)